MTPQVLEVLGLTRRFGAATGIFDVDFQIAAGEYFCIVGPSGSGKSTLLRILAGLETPEAGEIRLAGRRIDADPPERRNLHTVFQGYALFPHLSVFENVAFGLRMRRVPGAEMRPRVERTLALVGLSAHGDRRPGSLSGGEQQRVALARALVNRPAVLLLDEPLAALDRKLRLRMQEELSRIQRETEIAFVHVTHDQDEALRLADRLAIMNHGRFLQVGSPVEVYRRPRTAFVADFLGSANLFRAPAVSLDPLTIQIPDGPTVPLVGAAVGLRLGEEREYAVRPEALGVATGIGAATRAGLVRIGGRVIARARVGATDELRVKAGALLWTVQLRLASSDPIPGVGAEVTLLLDPADVTPLADDEPVPGRPIPADPWR